MPELSGSAEDNINPILCSCPPLKTLEKSKCSLMSIISSLTSSLIFHHINYKPVEESIQPLFQHHLQDFVLAI